MLEIAMEWKKYGEFVISSSEAFESRLTMDFPKKLLHMWIKWNIDIYSSTLQCKSMVETSGMGRLVDICLSRHSANQLISNDSFVVHIFCAYTDEYWMKTRFNLHLAKAYINTLMDGFSIFIIHIIIALPIVISISGKAQI